MNSNLFLPSEKALLKALYLSNRQSMPVITLFMEAQNCYGHYVGPYSSSLEGLIHNGLIVKHSWPNTYRYSLSFKGLWFAYQLELESIPV